MLTAFALGVWGWKLLSRDQSPAQPSSTGQTRLAASKPAAGNSAAYPISRSISTLNPHQSSTEIAKTLDDLKTTLASLPKDEAVAMIRQFLKDGRDRPTGLSFEIKADGSLAEWPTIRTFLLDVLLAIDPSAAADLSRGILAHPTTADEWALALRNVARGESPEQNAGYLRQKTEELITHPAWQADPSIGYLNAFDVLVHIEATASTPLLSKLVQNKDRKDLAHAAFLTIDRLVERQPVDELSLLASDPALQLNRPEMVAQQFARADVRDPNQRELMKSWLLDPSRTPNELRSFAGVYSNNNRFISNNLLTRASGQSGDDLVAHDRVALQTISTWANNPNFESVHLYLEVMISRLEGFVSIREPPSFPSPK